MRQFNLSFAAIFFILCITALWVAILDQKYWHLGTAILSLVLTIVFYTHPETRKSQES